MNDLFYIVACLFIVVLLIDIAAQKEPYLNFKGHFKSRRHFFFERCSKCGKKLKHYHWFWGKGDFMACDVDYHGNTKWFCEDCNNEQEKNRVSKYPHL